MGPVTVESEGLPRKETAGAAVFSTRFEQRLASFGHRPWRPFDRASSWAPKVHELDRPDVLPALMSEVDGTAALLRHSLNLLRTFGCATHDAEPLLVCLAAGTEKLTKLTYGLAMADSGGQWPSQKVMRTEFGHDINRLDRVCRDLLAERTPMSSAPGYLATLLAEVEADPLIPLVLTTVTDYGQQGRFHNLDTLAEGPRPVPSPRQRWDETERAVLSTRPDILARLGRSQEDWERARSDINEAIRTSVRAWWHLYWRGWITGAFGRRAQQWSATLDAPKD